MVNKKILYGILLMLAVGITLVAIVSQSNNKEDNLSTPNNIGVEELREKKITISAQEDQEDQEDQPMPVMIVNKEGDTIEKRYNPPKDFVRVEVDKESFEQFLRNQKLKPYGEKALYYNGESKRQEGVYDSVFDVAIGERDLHQCADAIMLLRAEYLYAQKNYHLITFHFSNGFKANYEKWMEGYRISVEGNNTKWVKQTTPSNTYEGFRKYMDMVFAYAGTASLEKELAVVNIEDIAIGDVLIKGGSPGHAVIVIDQIENTKTGQKAFMLAQSYMPAQQTQILINPSNQEISPWYLLETGETIDTPQWQFSIEQLRRFQ